MLRGRKGTIKWYKQQFAKALKMQTNFAAKKEETDRHEDGRTLFYRWIWSRRPVQGLSQCSHMNNASQGHTTTLSLSSLSLPLLFPSYLPFFRQFFSVYSPSTQFCFSFCVHLSIQFIPVLQNSAANLQTVLPIYKTVLTIYKTVLPIYKQCCQFTKQCWQFTKQCCQFTKQCWQFSKTSAANLQTVLPIYKQYCQFTKQCCQFTNSAANLAN